MRNGDKRPFALLPWSPSFGDEENCYMKTNMSKIALC